MKLNFCVVSQAIGTAEEKIRDKVFLEIHVETHSPEPCRTSLACTTQSLRSCMAPRTKTAGPSSSRCNHTDEEFYCAGDTAGV